MDAEDSLKIERFGGVGGFGIPGSAIRSQVQLNYSDLNQSELLAISELFAKTSKEIQPDGKQADFFRYRITLHKTNGDSQIEVGEHEMIESLKKRVRDELIS